VSSSSEILKISKQSPLESFDIELFINEVEQLPAILDSRSFRIKKTTIYMWETVCKNFTENIRTSLSAGRDSLMICVSSLHFPS